MTDVINKFTAYNLTAPALEKQQTARGANEWRQVFDKMMHKVFAATDRPGAGTGNHHLATVNEQNISGGENTGNKAEVAEHPVETHQRPIPRLAGNPEINTTPATAYLPQQNNEIDGIAINYNAEVQNPGRTKPEENITQNSSYIMDVIRKRLTKQNDRVHVALSGNDLKIYIHTNTGDNHAVRVILAELLRNLSHLDYAVTEIKLNGKTTRIN